MHFILNQNYEKNYCGISSIFESLKENLIQVKHHPYSYTMRNFEYIYFVVLFCHQLLSKMRLTLKSINLKYFAILSKIQFLTERDRRYKIN